MSQFESRLLVEGMRAIEGALPNQTTHLKQSSEKSFEALLFERAIELEPKLQQKTLFSHFKKLTKNIYTLLACILFILGAVAVQQMLFTDQLNAINFFWAFALFFIPNLLMLCAWLLLFFKPRLLKNSSLTKFTLVVIKFFELRFNKQLVEREHYWKLFSCYFELHFFKALGRYQLSKLTHLLWLSYFSGATLMSIVMLATHQVDFVWQTSILSAESFQTLTLLLAYVPEQLSLTVPTVEQIQQSHLGIETLLDAENRRLAWSSLFISSLFLYGLLPRLLLFMLFSYQLKQAKKQYQLDFSLPYYVQLRQILKPNKTLLGVSDADNEARVKHATHSVYPEQQRVLSMPTQFYPVAIELSEVQFQLAQQHLQQIAPNLGVSLSNICDYSAQQQLLAQLQSIEQHDIALYVALNRVPDRGLTRFFSQLTSFKDKQFHLCLIVEKSHSKQRDNDWFKLAESVTIKLDNILHIEVKGENNE